MSTDFLSVTQLHYLCMLLVGKAAEWAENNMQVQEIFEKEKPVVEDQITVQTLISRKFPTKQAEQPRGIDFSFIKLKQGPSESLCDYCQRYQKRIDHSTTK